MTGKTGSPNPDRHERLAQVGAQVGGIQPPAAAPWVGSSPKSGYRRSPDQLACRNA